MTIKQMANNTYPDREFFDEIMGRYEKVRRTYERQIYERGANDVIKVLANNMNIPISQLLKNLNSNSPQSR